MALTGLASFKRSISIPLLGGNGGGAPPPPNTGGRGTVSPYYDYGAKGDKAADDKQAFVEAIASGQVIDISAPNDDYKISAGDLLAGADDLYLTGKGTIWYPRSKPALTFAPVLGPKISIVSFRNVEHPAGLNVPVTSFVMPGNQIDLVAIGDVLAFRSTTKIGWGVPPAEDAGRGEEAEIIDVNRSTYTVYLNRILQWIGTPCRLRRRDDCQQYLPHAVGAEALCRPQHQFRVLRGHRRGRAAAARRGDGRRRAQTAALRQHPLLADARLDAGRLLDGRHGFLRPTLPRRSEQQRHRLRRGAYRRLLRVLDQRHL